MATKTNLINAINAKITAIITQAKHRLSMLEVVNEIYPDIIYETRTTTSHTSRITNPNLLKTDITYNVFIVKQGRLVTIKGRVWNYTGAIVSNSDNNDFIFEIVDSEFFPDEFSTATFFPVAQGTFVQFYGTDKKLYFNQLGSGDLVTFNIQYFTQD